MKFEIPQNVSRVTETLKKCGYDAYLVGGCVRDLVMHTKPKDFDLATNAKPEDIVQLFQDNGFKVVYENTFGTVAIIFEDEPHDSNVRQIEITPYRRETTYSNNRHPDAVEFADNLSDDLMRRDFTINALAFNPTPHAAGGAHPLGGVVPQTAPPLFLLPPRVLDPPTPPRAPAPHLRRWAPGRAGGRRPNRPRAS